MDTPISQFTDVMTKGSTLIRSYNTGTLDTSSLTPRFTLFRRLDGVEMGTVQASRVDGFNWIFIVPYAVTNLLEPGWAYELQINFDDATTSVQHGVVHYVVAPGVAHP
jgi:hypothetical protein